MKNTNHLTEKSILEILKEIEEVPQKYRKAITNNGGGFVNHNIYWSVMSPNPDNKERLPGGNLLSDINKYFGNFSQFVDIFTKEALTLFGSGYVWLSRNPSVSGKLLVTTTANQDSPISQKLQPILVLDVWEHAYYLKYQNRRPEHVSEWWKVVDWNIVEKLDNWWKDTPQHDEF